MPPTTKTPEKPAPAKVKAASEIKSTTESEPTISEKFLAKVERQYLAEIGPGTFSPLQRTLIQHLFLKIDQVLKIAEEKRQKTAQGTGDWAEKARKQPAYSWENVNQQKLAIDAVYIANVELDALIANHVHPNPYLNGRTNKYDFTLGPGYVGEMHVHTRFAVDPPLDVRCHLVYPDDVFDVIEDADGGERPLFKPHNRFQPEGKPIGGFGWILHQDPRKNRVIVVGEREFQKARNASGNAQFWGGEQTKWVTVDGKRKQVTEHDDKFDIEMMYKTVVRRVAAKIPLDSSKINMSSWNAVQEAQMDAIEAELIEDIENNANRGEPLSLSQGEHVEVPVTTAEKEPVRAEPPGEPAQRTIDEDDDPGY